MVTIILDRVYSNDVPEHEDIIRRKMVYVEDILNTEECIMDKDYTTVKLAGGEEFTVKEQLDTLRERLVTIINEAKTQEIIGG
jgi:hypothetical protein